MVGGLRMRFFCRLRVLGVLRLFGVGEVLVCWKCRCLMLRFWLN